MYLIFLQEMFKFYSGQVKTKNCFSNATVKYYFLIQNNNLPLSCARSNEYQSRGLYFLPDLMLYQFFLLLNQTVS